MRIRPAMQRILARGRLTGNRANPAIGGGAATTCSG